MKKSFGKILFLLLLVTGFACNQNREQSASGSHDANEVAEEKNEEKFDDKDLRKDADFVSEQVSMNYAEVELARLASERSNNSEVKRIAKSLIDAHQKTIADLGKLASAKAISVPSQADDKHLNKVNDLRDEKDVTKFNKDWCEEMVDTHEKAISDFEDRMKNTEDPELKNWIGNALPSMRTHLEQLKACHDKLKNS